MERLELKLGNKIITTLERHEKGTTINPLYLSNEEITDEMIIDKIGQLKDIFQLHIIPDENKGLLNELLLDGVCFSSYIELNSNRKSQILNKLN